ncbi:hypothetical protein [Actinomadura algeriensis]|uniref:Secreted protein n=1 Tax=Actinomadura algeriensis TaxID=1679523 RepID=A0ABR9JW99_9ACTN|nr:hypothetical protein [Actinomadura algeriensis]MBE1534678.1 hypothetical protein [Actinomadura algeriensis]
MKREDRTVRPRSRRVGVAAGVFGSVLLAITGCGATAKKQSFTDENGRACAYVLIEESDGDKEVGDIDCDFPPGHVPSAPPSPTPTG